MKLFESSEKKKKVHVWFLPQSVRTTYQNLQVWSPALDILSCFPDNSNILPKLENHGLRWKQVL